MDYKGKYNNQSSWCPCLWLSNPYESTLFSCYTPPCFSGIGSNLPLPEFPTLLPLITSWRVMKHFKFCVKLTGVVGVGKEDFGTSGQGFEMSLSRAWVGMWHPKAQPRGQGAAAALPAESPLPKQCQLLILSQVLLSTSVIFMWKFWAGMAQRCRTEGEITCCTPTGRARGEF